MMTTLTAAQMRMAQQKITELKKAGITVPNSQFAFLELAPKFAKKKCDFLCLPATNWNMQRAVSMFKLHDGYPILLSKSYYPSLCIGAPFAAAEENMADSFGASFKNDMEIANLQGVLETYADHGNWFGPLIRTHHDVAGKLIQPPKELIVGNTTYRLIVRSPDYSITVLSDAVPHTSKIYNYLDENNFYARFLDCREFKPNKFIRAAHVGKFDLDSAKVMHLLHLMTENHVNLPFSEVVTRNGDPKTKLLRVQLEKKLPKKIKPQYKDICAELVARFAAHYNKDVLAQLQNGDKEFIVINNIRISRTAATYENLTVRHPELLGVLSHLLDPEDLEYDIYHLIEDIATAVEESINRDNNLFTITSNDSESAVVDNLQIGEIPIRVTEDNSNRRRINGIPIKKNELSKCIARASCHDTLDNYNKFLKSVSALSLEMHNYLINGLPVKLSAKCFNGPYGKTLPDEEYIKNCPVLKMSRKNKKYFLELPAAVNNNGKFELSEEPPLLVQIPGTKFVNKIKSLNKKANGNYSKILYTRKNHTFVANNLRNIVRACSNNTEVGSALYYTSDGTVAAFDESILADFEVKLAILHEALAKKKEEAIVRSEEFLNGIVKRFKAKPITYDTNEGKKDAFLVKGKLRNYAVLRDGGGVYDYDTKGYICIVDSKRDHGVGYDTVASRIMALSNDSFTVNQITTLKK